jgi:hypothetical protein
MILTRSRPSLFLTGTMCLWGIMTCLVRFVDSYAGLVAMRFCLGIVEAGFVSSIFERRLETSSTRTAHSLVLTVPWRNVSSQLLVQAVRDGQETRQFVHSPLFHDAR